MLPKVTLPDAPISSVDSDTTPVRAAPLDAILGLIIAILVVSGCAYLSIREWLTVGNSLTAVLAAVLGVLTMLCLERDIRRHQLSLTSWWLLVAAFEVVVCIAVA